MSSLPILGIHGAPRSGTTWLGEIFNSAPQVAYRYQPFFAHAFRPRVDAAGSTGELERIVNDIAATEDDFILQRGSARLARRGTAFAKTAPTLLVYKEVRYHHLLPRLLEIPRFRAIGIVRSPLEVLASWVAAPREFDPSWELAAEWRAAPGKNGGRIEEFYGYEGWKRSAQVLETLAAADPQRVRIVRYADLTRDPTAETDALFAFAGLPMTDQTRDFIALSTSTADDDPYGVLRNGRRGGTRLPAEIEAEIRADLTGTPLERYL